MTRQVDNSPRAATGAGFTMLELIVVMALLAIITAAIVPIYGSSMASIQLKNARSSFVATINFVQARAVSESREYRVYMDEDEGSYWAGYLAGTEDDEKQFELVTAEFGQKKFLPSYLHFDRIKARKERGSGAYYIGCYPNGACDQVEVQFRDERERNGHTAVSTLGMIGKFEVK
jgi:prepilin-type N-terminal cleavage/methylation domain-containing protein